MKKYKSILGLNTVKAFIIVMLSLAIIAIVTLVVLSALDNGITIPTLASSATENNANVNSSGYTLLQSTLSGFSGTIVNVTNATDGVVFAPGNYTLTGGVLTNASATIMSNVNVSYTYTYYSSARNGIVEVTGNVSTGVTGFFANAGTFFSLLGVVVIILIISLVVVVVNRFGGSAERGEETSL